MSDERHVTLLLTFAPATARRPPASSDTGDPHRALTIQNLGYTIKEPTNGKPRSYAAARAEGFANATTSTVIQGYNLKKK
jgi:hypothetical protein